MKKKIFTTLFVLGLLVVSGFTKGADNKTAETPPIKTQVLRANTTYHSTTLETLKANIEAASSGDTIIIDSNITIPSTDAGVSVNEAPATAYISINKNLTLMGSSSTTTIKREGPLSILEIIGNNSINPEKNAGDYVIGSDEVTVNLVNLVFDGGAVLTGNNPTWTNSGVKGRSVIDVANSAILNVESGTTIQNGWCSIPTSTHSTDVITDAYGGGIRINVGTGKTLTGGRVNLRSGSRIEKCVAKNDGTIESKNDNSGYGGGIGGYDYSELYITGGTIENCYAKNGGAVSGNYNFDLAKNLHIHMYAGSLTNNKAVAGGAIANKGNAGQIVSGGSITNNSASEKGGAVANLDDEKASQMQLPDPDVVNTLDMSGNTTIGGNFTYQGYSQITYALTSNEFVLADTNFTYFNSNGGTSIATLGTQQTWGFGLSHIFPDYVAKDGYAFGGWYLESTFETPCTSSTALDHRNVITLYAKWLTTYSVTFDSKGGSTVPSMTCGEGLKINKPANPTKTGHSFAGWYSDEYLYSNWDFDTDTVTENTTLYAKWTPVSYTITFNTDGGSTIANRNADYGTKITKPSDPTKDHFSFAGWFKDATLTAYWDFTNDTVAGNTTLYAKWEDIWYTAEFNTDGGSTIAPYVGVYGSLVTKPTDPTKSGYAFKGWYRNSNFTTVFDFDTMTLPGSITIYAKWVAVYTVTFDSKGGSAIDPVTVETGGSIEKPTDPVRAGYTLEGWYKESGYYSKWEFSYVVTKNMTLYAKWTKSADVTTYSVTFDSNGGSEVSGITANAGATITKPTDPTKTGYTFAGWYKESTFTNAWDFTTDTVTANTTLYAKWTAAAGTIEVSSVTLDATSKTLEPGGSVTLTATVLPADATNKTVTWTSSDTAVATVSSAGKVTAVAVGTATITATSGSQTATCTITVKAASQVEVPTVSEPTKVTSTSFTATWTAVTDAISYELDVSTDINFTTFVEGYQAKVVTGTSVVVEGLEENTTYYYRMRSKTSSGLSENSQVVTVALSSAKGLGAGAITGIVIGSIVLLLLLLIAGLYILWKKKNYRYSVFAVVLVPIFRFINKLLFKTPLNDVELEEEKNKETQKEKKDKKPAEDNK